MKWNNYFDKDFFRYLGLFSQIGLTIFINVAISIYLYKIVEKYLFKSWHFFIFMIILGIVNGFYRVYKLIFYKSENNKKGKE
ncbi:AtpZ/AtpI family protein [Fusobacterium massiliense]|jgi:putative ATP synthase protein I|uniref:AtpZ/AtpI family protein n=1 Tax=Fusobacterium massiliense TaxID=1852365 RepID=UPI00093FAC66|nr:AtpZ/AtpI family protein [Fusobacterium massiliense]